MLSKYLTTKQIFIFIKDHSFVAIDDTFAYRCSYKCLDCNLYIVIRNKFLYASFNDKFVNGLLNELMHNADFIYDLKTHNILKQRYNYLILSHNEQIIKNIIE